MPSPSPEGGVDVQPILDSEKFSGHHDSGMLALALCQLGKEIEKVTGRPQKVELVIAQEPDTDNYIFIIDQCDPICRQSEEQ